MLQCHFWWQTQHEALHVETLFGMPGGTPYPSAMFMSDHSPELCGHVLVDYHLGDLFVVDVKLAAKNPKAITGGVHMVALVLSPVPAGRNILKNNMHVKRSLEDWFVRAATRMWRCIRKDLYAFSSICSDAAWKTAAFLQNLGRGIEALLRWRTSMYTLNFQCQQSYCNLSKNQGQWTCRIFQLSWLLQRIVSHHRNC